MGKYADTKPEIVSSDVSGPDIEYSYRFCGEDFKKVITLDVEK